MTYTEAINLKPGAFVYHGKFFESAVVLAVQNVSATEERAIIHTTEGKFPRDQLTTEKPKMEELVDKLLKDPKTKVHLRYNNDLGYHIWCWAVVIDDSPDFWLDAFSSRDEAMEYIERNKLAMEKAPVVDGSDVWTIYEAKAWWQLYQLRHNPPAESNERKPLSEPTGIHIAVNSPKSPTSGPLIDKYIKHMKDILELKTGIENLDVSNPVFVAGGKAQEETVSGEKADYLYLPENGKLVQCGRRINESDSWFVDFCPFETDTCGFVYFEVDGPGMCIRMPFNFND